jgi:hypothetical protein
VKRTRRTEITVETEQVLLVRPNRSPLAAWCPQCEAEAPMVTPEEAVALTGQSLRQVCRLVEAGRLHFTETGEGLLRLCLNSLPISTGTQKENVMTTRRTLFTLVIGALIAIAALGAAPQAFAQTVDEPDRPAAPRGNDALDAIERAKQAQIKAFTGSWEGIFTPEDGGPPPFRIMLTFGANGEAVEADGGPPDPQNATPGNGAWERTGDNEFTVIYKQLLFDTAGSTAATFKARVRFKLDPVKMEISGPVKVDLYEPNGANFLSGAGTIKCSKIRVEPLD